MNQSRTRSRPLAGGEQRGNVIQIGPHARLEMETVAGSADIGKLVPGLGQM